MVLSMKDLSDHRSDLSIKSLALEAKLSADIMDYNMALSHISKALEHMEKLGVSESSAEYLMLKFQKLGYMILADQNSNSENLQSLVALHFTAINSQEGLFCDESPNPESYNKQIIEMNLIMADVYTKVLSNPRLLQSLEVILNQQSLEGKQSINVKETLCFVGTSL